MTEIIGYVVWDGSAAYRGHVYYSRASAEKVLAAIVWHSQQRYTVRPVCLAEIIGEQSESSNVTSRTTIWADFEEQRGNA